MLRKSNSKPSKGPAWRNPFSTFLSTGPKKRYNQFEFACYDLSKDEIYSGNSEQPMKEVPKDQRKILDNNREKYLEVRWDFLPPHAKYNFPEATSWRYGWNHTKEVSK